MCGLRPGTGSERQKLDKKAVKLRFVGYAKTSKGYRLLDGKTEKIVTRRDVVFNETNFSLETEPEPAKPQEVVVEVEGSMEHRRQQEVPPEVGPRRSDRDHRRPVRFGFDEYADVATVENCVHHFSYSACQIMEPKTMEEALSSVHAKEWKAATDSEFDSLTESETWELVELLPDRKPIGCKWVFKVKHGSDGSVERFKGRLVGKGCSQKYGIDYDETFSPVVRFSSIRGLLAFAVQNDMLIHQMDVVTAFLNERLDEEIYMAQRDGYGGSGPWSIKEYQFFPNIFLLLPCVPLYVCRLCINFQELCTRLLGMATLRILLLTFISRFVIDFLSIRKVIIFSAIATDGRQPLRSRSIHQNAVNCMTIRFRYIAQSREYGKPTAHAHVMMFDALPVGRTACRVRR